jgi:5-oxoprolinase (ATP-hydrolysing) subunit C
MSAAVIVESPGAGVAVQDCGRPSFRAIGLPPGGALDSIFLAAANALGGAAENAAGLEILLAAPSFRVARGPLRLGLAGALTGELTRADGRRESVASWRGVVLHTGDALALKLARGPAYLGFSGGLDLPLVLGARATFLRGGFGGLDGRMLARGDALPCAVCDEAEFAAPPFAHQHGPLRFIPGPQAENFTPDARQKFEASEWRVGADSDRMGARLAGPKLDHRPGGANIISDGATPGAIQVPGDGQPILLRADCQTSGGYAKIGCVITADLGRSAHLSPGDAARFESVDHAEAAAARKNLRENFARWRAAIARVEQGWDAERLWSENLISGAVFGE